QHAGENRPGALGDGKEQQQTWKPLRKSRREPPTKDPRFRTSLRAASGAHAAREERPEYRQKDTAGKGDCPTRPEPGSPASPASLASGRADRVACRRPRIQCSARKDRRGCGEEWEPMERTGSQPETTSNPRGRQVLILGNPRAGTGTSVRHVEELVGA